MILSECCEKCSPICKMKQILKQNYLHASLPGSLSGLQSFSRTLKERGVVVNPNKVKEYLTSEPADTLHKPARRKYKRNKVTSLGIDYRWQLDLVDLQKFSKSNKGYKYLLTCIDVFSKQRKGVFKQYFFRISFTEKHFYLYCYFRT
jgi:hypothetical protein